MVVRALRCFGFEASVELPPSRVKSSHDTLARSPTGRNYVFFINVFVFDPLVELPPSRVKSSHDTRARSPTGRNYVFFVNVFDPLVELPPSRCLYLFSFQVNDDVFGIKR